MEKTGIWIDKRQAWVLRLDGQQEHFEVLQSEVEDFNPAGGYGGKVPYSAQVANPEDKIQNRQEAQLHRFFDQVIDRVKSSSHVLIEGPAEAKTGLYKQIATNNQLKSIIVEARSSDKKTENQFKSGIREFFNAKN
jgi:stalled ribosome rescue protein Dom34